MPYVVIPGCAEFELAGSTHADEGLEPVGLTQFLNIQGGRIASVKNELFVSGRTILSGEIRRRPRKLGTVLESGAHGSNPVRLHFDEEKADYQSAS